jgi:hypothetical protein
VELAELLLSIALRIALAATVGLRVFLPLFALSMAAHAGWAPIAGSFAWLATPPALVRRGTAAAST